ncbi:MAG: HAMP domain-containing histidine kinase [Candidatus Marinimicrobia bacterium]|nr:HAMP domain-containing histidine kinase [Candidatus Neomarinimicrobiota bacterium]
MKIPEKKQHSPAYYIFIFVLAQVAWLGLLGLWIYRYVYNVIILKSVGDKLPADILSPGKDIFVLVGGFILLIAISFGMSMIFRNLNVQIKLTRLYDNFIASITHELKTPLASIQLYLETLQARDVPPEKRKEFYDVMLRESNRLRGLIDTILEVAGLERKKQIYNFEVFQTDEIINAMVNEVRDQFNLPEDAIRLVGEAPCQCVAERNYFKILFNNLTDNAIKYTNGPVRITVRLACTGKNIRIEFQDNGIGIPLKDQRKIFRIFQRLNRANIPNVKGSGLGLYMVNEIVKYHGGKIWVYSKGENKGTSFIIELPVYQAAKRRYLDRLLKKSP